MVELYEGVDVGANCNQCYDEINDDNLRHTAPTTWCRTQQPRQAQCILGSKPHSSQWATTAGGDDDGDDNDDAIKV